jgi:hypothetical protein
MSHQPSEASMLFQLVAAAIGPESAQDALAVLAITPALRGPDAGDAPVPRATLAMALNVVLFAELLDRVPAARRYIVDMRARGERTVFDHGALRTIDGETGALPRGVGAITRLLAPLGYAVAGEYPLPRLAMTGQAWAHLDDPEGVPQFFVSELHVGRLPAPAQAAAARVFATSRDPLSPVDRVALDFLAQTGTLSFAEAAALLPALARAFDRHHKAPALADYEALLAASAEAAWIATEGNAFNHATHRVADVEQLAATLRDEGYAIKPAVEVSANGRVRQTALIADKVVRSFITNDGVLVERAVPGSFFEFITRASVPGTGALDLTFDSGNATGIFAMTRA